MLCSWTIILGQKGDLKDQKLDLQDGVVKLKALYLQDVANQVEILDPKCIQLQDLLTTFFFLQNHSKTHLKAQNFLSLALGLLEGRNHRRGLDKKRIWVHKDA